MYTFILEMVTFPTCLQYLDHTFIQLAWQSYTEVSAGRKEFPWIYNNGLTSVNLDAGC